MYNVYKSVMPKHRPTLNKPLSGFFTSNGNSIKKI